MLNLPDVPDLLDLRLNVVLVVRRWNWSLNYCWGDYLVGIWVA